MSRRQKTLGISGELIESWLKDVPDIPEDAKVRGARYHPFTNTVEFLLESTEFPEVTEGNEPEVID